MSSKRRRTAQRKELDKEDKGKYSVDNSKNITCIVQMWRYAKVKPNARKFRIQKLPNGNQHGWEEVREWRVQV